MMHAGSKVPACRNWAVGDTITANLADVDCMPCRVHHGLRLDRGEAAQPAHPDHAGRPIFYLAIYDAAHGSTSCLHRLQYIRLWRVAIFLERIGLTPKARELSRRADDMIKQRSNDERNT